MNIFRPITAFALAALCTAPAAAVDESPFLVRTAGDLATLCSATANSTNGTAAIHMCEGYIVGVHQLHTAMMSKSKSGGLYCVPQKGVPSRNEVAVEFARWVRSSPGIASLPAVEGLMRWAASRFPCS